MGRRALLPRRLALLAAVGLLLGAVGQAQAGLGSGAPARSVLPDGLGIAHALAVQESFNEAVLSLDGVVGTGVGRDASGRATVKLFTESRAIAGLPDVLAGVPVEVEVTGRIRVRVDATGRLARPVFSGVSSGHPAVGAGTVGARVTKNGNLYALSNNHVFANSGFAAIGDSLLQPAVTDGGEEPDDVFATLAEFEPIDFSRGGHNTIDAALGLTTSSELAATTPEDGYGAPGTTTVAAHVGQLVQKYGRTTGLTSGVVEAINVSILACYAEFFTRCVQSASFDNQIAIADISGPFSRNGDSGSLIVTDDASRNPVGLLFAGGAGTTFANPIDAVLDALRVTIDGDGAPAVEPASPERREAMYFVLRPAAALGSASFEDEDIAYYDGGDFGLHFRTAPTSVSPSLRSMRSLSLGPPRF